MSELLDRARASLEGVTEGPWLAILSDYDEESSVVSETERTEHGWGYSVAVDLLRSNAAFIAASRQLVPELIAEVEQLQSSRDLALAEERRLRELYHRYFYLAEDLKSEIESRDALQVEESGK